MSEMPRVPRVHPLNINANQQSIKTAVRQGRFVPFLGAGASSLRPEKLDLTQSPWRESKLGVTALGDYLWREAPSNPEAYKYLRSFAEQRFRLSSTDLDALLPEQGALKWPVRPLEENDKSGQAWPSEAILNFQASLCALGGYLGKRFGHAFSTSYPSVDQLGQCKVRVRQSEDGAQQGLRHIRNVLNGALELPAESEYPAKVAKRPYHLRPKLRVDAIQRKLLALAWELVPPSLWGEAEWTKIRRSYHRFEPLPEDLPRAEEEWAEIFLSMVQWISDLLWYSMRYWMPIYPTTSELAFELSLAAEAAPPRRAELAQAAEALFLSEKGLVEETANILRYLEGVREEPGRFHLVMAAMLGEMFARGGTPEVHGPSASLLEGEEGVPRGNMTLAFTTNFDRALERALEALEITHHVLYPVVRESRAWRTDPSAESSGGVGQEEALGQRVEVQYVEWVLRTWSSEDITDRPFNTPRRCDPEEELPFGKQRLLGPVIVKLHGSPLDPLWRGYQHWIVLSESGYLRAMDLRASRVPKWVEVALQIPKQPTQSLWFLGYSVSDWNIRLRLYEHVHHTHGWSESAEKSVVDYSRHLDLFRLAIFGNLRIEVCQGDLNLLASIIEQALIGEGRRRLESYRN